MKNLSRAVRIKNSLSSFLSSCPKVHLNISHPPHKPEKLYMPCQNCAS